MLFRSEIFTFVKLLNINKIINDNKNNDDVKKKLCDIFKNIQIVIIIHFNNFEYMKKEISDLLGVLGYKFNDIINYDEISNLDNIIKQITSNNLKNFLFYNGIGISNYLENMEMIYKDLVKLAKIRPSEKLLIKARRQYIHLSDIFYNIVGIPQKSFIEPKEIAGIIMRSLLYFYQEGTVWTKM